MGLVLLAQTGTAGRQLYAPATAATNALANNADIAKVQEWLGHSDISATRMYDKQQSRPEDSPTFKVRYQDHFSDILVSVSLVANFRRKEQKGGRVFRF